MALDLIGKLRGENLKVLGFQTSIAIGSWKFNMDHASAVINPWLTGIIGVFSDVAGVVLFSLSFQRQMMLMSKVVALTWLCFQGTWSL